MFKKTKKSGLKRLENLKDYREITALASIFLVVGAIACGSLVWVLPLAGYLWAQLEKKI